MDEFFRNLCLKPVIVDTPEPLQGIDRTLKCFRPRTLAGAREDASRS